jgi:hypothetical protein
MWQMRNSQIIDNEENGSMCEAYVSKLYINTQKDIHICMYVCLYICIRVCKDT